MLDLSDEVWGALSEVLSAHTLSKLWICGSRVLQQRLTRGVSHFDLEYGSERPFLWPTFISRFPNLYSLRIDCHKDKSSGKVYLYVSNVDLELISPSVRQISLLFANGLFALCQRDLEPSAATMSLVDLKSRFPYLGSLEFYNCYQNEGWFNAQKSMPNWPNLLSLDLTSTFQSVDIAWLKHLPETLINLKVMLSFDIDGDWRSKTTFPPNLTCIACHTPTFEILGFIGPALKTCDLILFPPPSSYFQVDQETAHLQNLKQFTDLTHLTFNPPAFSPEVAPMLPPNLKYLKVDTKHLYKDVLVSLPPTLEILQIRHSGVTAGTLYQDPSQLPTTLKEMPKFLFSESDPASWAKLPRGLCRLVPCPPLPLLSIEARDKMYLADLPKNFEEVSLYYETKAGFEFQDMPRLQRLSLTNCVNLGPLAEHLTSLTHLQLYSAGALDCTPLRGLRSPLRRLVLGEQVIPSGLNLLFLAPDPYVPSGLAQLKELVLPAKFHAGIEDLEEWIQTLPPTLEQFNQHSIPDPVSLNITLIPPSALLNLPHSLTSFKGYINDMEWSHIIQLPPNLANLTVMGKSCLLKPHDLHLLPRPIRNLVIPPSPYIVLNTQPNSPHTSMDPLTDFLEQRKLVIAPTKTLHIISLYQKDDTNIPTIEQLMNGD